MKKKTKPLTLATKIYKELKSHVKRGKSLPDSVLAKVKHDIGQRLKEELNYHDAPTVSFVVDLHKAWKAKKVVAVGLSAKSDVFQGRDHDGVPVYFVYDQNDYFLRQDLSQKRRPPVPSDDVFAGTVSSKKLKKDSPQVGTLATLAVATSIVQNCRQNESRTPATSKSPTNSSITKPMATSEGELRVGLPSPPQAPRFLLEAKTDQSLDDQIENACFRWVEASKNTPGMSRKLKLVEKLKQTVAFYKRVLEEHNPFPHSIVPELWQLNETLFLITVANTLGNSMICWYDRFPDTCGPDEANPWALEISSS